MVNTKYRCPICLVEALISEEGYVRELDHHIRPEQIRKAGEHLVGTYIFPSHPDCELRKLKPDVGKLEAMKK